MDIIFDGLPRGLGCIAVVLRKLGFGVYYCYLHGEESCTLKEQRGKKLGAMGVLPLPFDDATELSHTSANNYDPGKLVYKRSQALFNKDVLNSQASLYQNNKNIIEKLKIILFSNVRVAVTGAVNTWARAHKERNHVLIFFSLRGMLHPELVDNVKVLIVPLNILLTPMRVIMSRLRVFIKRLFQSRPVKNVSDSRSEKAEVDDATVAFVTHDGLAYGKLFEKTLYYSNHEDSPLHPSKILHIDYCGVTSPSKELNWVCLKSNQLNLFDRVYYFMQGVMHGLLHVSTFQHVLGLFVLSKFYVTYQSYLRALASYKSLKIALIDYEILCPKALLLALETKNIKTVAAQERVMATFYSATLYAFIDDYFVASDFMMKVMRNSPSYQVQRYLPVGQYRSDKLVIARDKVAPELLREPLKEGRRVIVALGYHTPCEWYLAKRSCWLNWLAHKHFIEDMLRLAEAIPNTFIVLRYKMIDWLRLPVFAPLLKAIEASKNIHISSDYSKQYVSYDLCAHADLVIAKHTSLADECLSVGIPVLLHEYTHNTKRLFADAFDYKPAPIMCFNYHELLDKSRDVLNGMSSDMKDGYHYLKQEVYGGLGDGQVKQRIHQHVESLLE